MTNHMLVTTGVETLEPTPEPVPRAPDWMIIAGLAPAHACPDVVCVEDEDEFDDEDEAFGDDEDFEGGDEFEEDDEDFLEDDEEGVEEEGESDDDEEDDDDDF